MAAIVEELVQGFDHGRPVPFERVGVLGDADALARGNRDDLNRREPEALQVNGDLCLDFGNRVAS